MLLSYEWSWTQEKLSNFTKLKGAEFTCSKTVRLAGLESLVG